MSGQITSELIRRLLALGCDSTTLVLCARFIEHPRGGMEMFEAIVTGFERRSAGDTFNDFFTKFYAALNWPEPREAANDETTRMSSHQRRLAYRGLVERDGETCSKCGCNATVIWRRMGVYTSAEGWRYTKVHPTTSLEVDHIEPLWAGGGNELENLWLLCVPCHKVKTAHEAGQRRLA